MELVTTKPTKGERQIKLVRSLGGFGLLIGDEVVAKFCNSDDVKFYGKHNAVQYKGRWD